jgi:phosphate starvation-inducible protein PhoH and related proteins
MLQYSPVRGKVKRFFKNRVIISDMPKKNIKEDTSMHIPQAKKIDFSLGLRIRQNLTDRQQEILGCMTDKQTRIVFIDGPAGTSKTFLAVLAGLQ